MSLADPQHERGDTDDDYPVGSKQWCYVEEAAAKGYDYHLAHKDKQRNE